MLNSLGLVALAWIISPEYFTSTEIIGGRAEETNHMAVREHSFCE